MYKEGIVESPFTLYRISNDFQNWTQIYDFPIRHSIKNHRWIRLDMFDAISYKGFLFVVNSAEYRIIKYDLNKSKIERIFSRKYVRQKIRKDVEDETVREVKRLNLHLSKYFFDIFGIRAVNDSLWVITSTRMEDNSRWLIDVFGMEGKFLDSFYLQFPNKNFTHDLGWALFTDDGFIYIPEQNQETGYRSIGKYQLKNMR